MPSRKTAQFAAITVAAGIAGLIGFGFTVLAQQMPTGATPKRHLKIERPAHLSTADAVAIYAEIADQMSLGYGWANNPAAGKYRKWRRYNKAPFLSATHGNRYCNCYGNGNGLTSAYAKRDSTVRMPAGAVLAKDCFTVTAGGDVFAAPLFLMEKLAADISPETNDWRYVMILPDGSLFGDSRGEAAGKVGFCHACHRSAEETDNLFFVPKKYRKRFSAYCPKFGVQLSCRYLQSRSGEVAGDRGNSR